MKHLELETSNCKEILKNKHYALCLGAGICHGIMPDWQELTFDILKATIDPALTTNEFDTICQKLGWSLDSILQAVLNYVQESGGSTSKFEELIQVSIYSKIINNATKYGLGSKLQRFISDPFHRNTSDIIDLYNFFVDNYELSSLFQISRFLIEAEKKHQAPSAILTLNADVLLHSLLTLMQLKEEFDNTGKANGTDFRYKAVHHVIESDGHKIPIYHIHGSIVPLTRKRDARQNLVFQETSYHAVSGSNHSWQQVIFQFYALKNRFLFIGLSMSDPNVRRWLAHTSSVLNNDIINLPGENRNATPHIWVTPKAKFETERKLKQLGLSHLGTKVGEIEDWSKLHFALTNLVS